MEVSETSVTGCCVATLDPFVSVHNVRVVYGVDGVHHSDPCEIGTSLIDGP